ncbi:hypothetical protein DPMN_169232 [Dreissena polymorpha]|uniref:Uncharacterized protein n=1 Tax=Dreissena polymorpha TaxID=45954 RepID=A0A9D4F3C3_DREPO|nr:hypothetical protein DPMN_169232 [Dreissena polymorpha]
MQDFTDLLYTTIPQLKDSNELCIKRDASDLENMQRLQPANPTLLILFENIVT